MGQRQQTSVRISTRAYKCLSAIARERGVSRDQAVRDLLNEHVAAQAAAPEEERLTHIFTVLRYPPFPPGRGPDGRVRLAPRLDAGVAARAGSMSLRLPGQAPRRGFRDYGARPLTDALVTAIARVNPFVDDGLDGLPSLLMQREALGLWRLTVAATLTRAEQRALLSSQVDETAEVLREEDVAWHHPWRFEVALHLARRLLTGAQAKASRRMLWNQTEAFDGLRSDLELSDDLDHPLLDGLAWPDHDLQGRGGSAVWRAQRTLAVERLAKWLTTSAGATTIVEPPGWTLAVPEGWRGLRFKYGAALPAQQQADLNSARVVRVDAGSRFVLWPYNEVGAPIRGFDSVIAGAGDVQPAELVELVLVTAEDTETYPRVPAATAFDLGFISTVERDDLIAAAADQTRTEIAAALLRAHRLDEEDRERLRAAANDPEQFMRLARRWRLRCHVVRPTWTWRVESLAEAVVMGASQAQLQWLAGATRRIHRHALERRMQEAWTRAFWQGGTIVDDGM